ncbi:hypothetical protein AAHA92_25275 [Salvia divinorum]|uniref:Uncharacterized protein n=1 Tax=Salvia divinorum TaxID=28513 RepID=A0ABD1GD94_SALDI
MAASANPSAAAHSNISNGANSGSSKGSAKENSAVEPNQRGLRHNPGLSLDWTTEEQSKLEDLLAKYASETTVARKRRRKEDNGSSRKNKDKKDKVSDTLPKSSQVANRTNGPPACAQSLMSVDSDDRIPFNAIGGAAGQLLESNAQALDQISTNFSACKIHENINLFCQARANIVSILNDLGDMPESMKQMPPLPVKLNEELANSILPRTPLPKKS